MWVDYFLVLFTISCFANMLGIEYFCRIDSGCYHLHFNSIPHHSTILLSGVIVRFEKLNPLLPHKGSSISRWYHGFPLGIWSTGGESVPNNAYEKNFYELEAAMSETTIRKDYWISEVSKSIDKNRTTVTIGRNKARDWCRDQAGPKRNHCLRRSHIRKEFRTNTENGNRCDYNRNDSWSAWIFKISHEKLIDDFNAVNERKEELISVMTKYSWKGRSISGIEKITEMLN